MLNVMAQIHYYIIKVYDKPGGTLIEMLKWDGMTFEQRNKWNWYFVYRAALLQVKYPRYRVDCYWGNDRMTKQQFIEKKLKDHIIAKKRIISKYENKLADFVSNWNEIFPVHQDSRYLNAVAKINRLKTELQKLESGDFEINN